MVFRVHCFVFFFNDTATTEIYTLSLHDALPIYAVLRPRPVQARQRHPRPRGRRPAHGVDRKSTRLNSSHANISYAVFCLKKKKNNKSDYLHVDSTQIDNKLTRPCTELPVHELCS